MSKTNFFANCKTLEELKKEYKKLAMLHHPDRGGRLETMQAVNNEYDELFPLLKNKHNKENTKNQTTEGINDYKDIINQLIKYRDITIELCGTWLYVYGDGTKAIKDIISDLGFWWANKKKMWYLKPEGFISHKHKTWSMDAIRETYGSNKIETQKPVYIS
ncbi:MAG: molecular chaperone DnaJ [Tissierellia bacterium]|nr:molecular chaperone DnaJ [Tissierellia bacterium]